MKNTIKEVNRNKLMHCKIGLRNDNFKNNNPVIHKKNVIVRGELIEFHIELGHMSMNNGDYGIFDTIYMIEINNMESLQKDYEKRLSWTFGKQIYFDFSKAAKEVVLNFYFRIQDFFQPWPTFQGMVVENGNI